MAMTDANIPDPAAARAEWLAAHPGATPVSAHEASGAVASHLGAGAPDPGVSDETLAGQVAASGAHAGVTPTDGTLPAEAMFEQMMAEIRRLSNEVDVMKAQRQREHQAAIAALGEPILERYARGVRDKMKAHMDAHPALGRDHFGPVLTDASALYDQAHAAVAGGANDLSIVRQLASQVERFVEKTHPRIAPAHAGQVDFSALLYDLEMMLEEADRLAPRALAFA